MRCGAHGGTVPSVVLVLRSANVCNRRLGDVERFEAYNYVYPEYMKRLGKLQAERMCGECEEASVYVSNAVINPARILAVAVRVLLCLGNAD